MLKYSTQTRPYICHGSPQGSRGSKLVSLSGSMMMRKTGAAVPRSNRLTKTRYSVILLELIAEYTCLTHSSELIRSISDPEYPNSLEELRVVSAEQIEIGENHVVVEFTPTVPHCGMSTLIGIVNSFHLTTHGAYHRCPSGLCIRVRLLRSLPPRFKVDIRVKPGSHQSELAGALSLASNTSACSKLAPYSVNKQLNDKERVAAALENPSLVEALEKCLDTAALPSNV